MWELHERPKSRELNLESNSDARTRRLVLALHRRVVHRTHRALAARLQLGTGADDGSRRAWNLAGGRYRPVYNRVEGYARRVAARSRARLGFLPGAEDEFEALIRAQCRWLESRGLDRLSLFTSEASAGFERVSALAS